MWFIGTPCQRLETEHGVMHLNITPDLWDREGLPYCEE